MELPTSTTQRALEDLVAQRLAAREDKESGANRWRRKGPSATPDEPEDFLPAKYSSEREDTEEPVINGTKEGLTPSIISKKEYKEDFAGKNPSSSLRQPRMRTAPKPPRFRKVGAAQPGTACAQCQSDAGNIFRITDGTVLGGKAETLHFACAEAWFDAVKNG